MMLPGDDGGLPGPGTRVVVAMSGGIDSTAAAILLLEAGCEVLGFTIQSRPCGEEAPRRGCCSEEDVRAARLSAGDLGVPHYVVDGTAVFEEEVVAYARRAYGRGLTPNPCALCNERVRFGLLLGRARDAGAAYLATGHHARLRRSGRLRLLRGLDRGKDQSYFLCRLGPRALAAALFPLGETTKGGARALLSARGLPARRESQDLCFLDRREGWPAGPVRIVDEEGRELGRGRGLHNYTVGQRRGLGLGGGEERYVLALDGEAGTVTVGPRERLLRQSFPVEDVHWVSVDPPRGLLDCRVQIRHRHDAVEGTVTPLEGGAVRVDLAAVQEAVAPGQVAAFYDGDLLLGGGFIGTGP